MPPCGPNSWGGNVQVNSFYASAITNMFVQITLVSPLAGYAPLNSDPFPPGFDSSIATFDYPSGPGSTESWCFENLGTGAFVLRGEVCPRRSSE